MSRILKVAAAVVAAALVVAGAVVVYRETDLLTGSLVLLCGLMIAALVVRRAAVREERAGMADWQQETLDSEKAAADLFGDWSASAPTRDRTPTTPVLPSAPTVAPPVAPNGSGPARPVPAGAEVPQPADPSVAVSRPLRSGSPDGPEHTEQLVASLFRPDEPAAATGVAGTTTPADTAGEPVAAHADPDPLGVDQFISAPDLAMAGAGAPGATVDQRSPIDWTGQGGRVDERVRSDDDIMRVSEATALTPAEGGSELARLLSKVEARLREYD